MKVLVTGGAGYIGSHTVVELVAAGFDVHIVDNFCNSERWILERLATLCGRGIPHTELDLLDEAALQACFAEVRPGAVIHFAALKAVGESVQQPLRYHRNNVGGTLALLQAMQDHGCPHLVFSSSATVYGVPERCPIREDAPLGATNPYGQTKLVMEHVIRDLLAAPGSTLKAAILRYFNPAGAHESGLIGELPRGVPNNLVPFVAQTAAGLREAIQVFGNDYPTRDGTGVRDYIHVVDLAQAHVAALRALRDGEAREITVNLGTGTGYSVLEVIEAFGRAVGRPIPHRIAPRRPGDVAECWADPALAERLLGWKARRGLDAMCTDAWRWQKTLSPSV
ncbi:UDP-glucose 4-epimerase GalE [Silanimonas lenta]|uniref:UDP-glucose 4-epimerase GalE n=1 Tax=Silanimonas lenta TaxID=265429 RepID=UPI0004104BC5|nr:UDP-glucose 4-epimerase GalE [Silanimonas lenta]